MRSQVTSFDPGRAQPRSVDRPLHDPCGAHQPADPRARAGEAHVGGVRLGEVREAFSAWDTGVKRVFDIVLASAALLALAPVLAALSLAIRLDSRGGVLFRQVRVGRSGRPFVLFKLRTMVPDAEELRASLLIKSRDPHWLDLEHDPRVTRLGRLLRHTSLDGLPQLWNVVRGDMSLVGPRPLIPVEHARIGRWARARDRVRPGLTGLWQVSGRTQIPFAEMLVLDDLYISRWSLRTDLEILLRTPAAVFSRRGSN